MEYLEGQPLKRAFADRGRPAARIQIAGAIEARTARVFLHRDLKTANVMITATGAKLLDFGLAR